MMNNKNEDEKEARKYYSTVRKEGYELIIKSSIAYDRSIITLATVFFGFIFSMVRFSNGQLSSCKNTLTFILILLILTVLFSLISFWVDQLYGRKLIMNADNYIKSRDDTHRKTPVSYYVSLILKILAGTFFFFSLILLFVIFLSQ